MTGSGSWFDSPPPQHESRWQGFKEGWVRWWRDYWVIPIITLVAIAFIVLIFSIILGATENSIDPEPGEIHRVFIVEFEGEEITCIRIDGWRGISCDWD